MTVGVVTVGMACRRIQVAGQLPRLPHHVLDAARKAPFSRSVRTLRRAAEAFQATDLPRRGLILYKVDFEASQVTLMPGPEYLTALVRLRYQASVENPGHDPAAVPGTQEASKTIDFASEEMIVLHRDPVRPGHGLDRYLD